MKRDICWREAKRVRLFYTVIIFGLSALFSIISYQLDLDKEIVASVLFIPSSICWGVLSSKVDEYKPIYLERNKP
jgi:uncharacterized membrane protein